MDRIVKGAVAKGKGAKGKWLGVGRPSVGPVQRLRVYQPISSPAARKMPAPPALAGHQPPPWQAFATTAARSTYRFVPAPPQPGFAAIGPSMDSVCTYR